MMSDFFKAANSDTAKWTKRMKSNISILNNEEKELINLLLELGQDHLFEQWDSPGTNDERKHCFLEQIKLLHSTYPIKGGLSAYISRAKELLELSRLGENPFNGWTPEVPTGIVLDNPFSEEYRRLEQIGLSEVGACGFVLVAGGLGERLGYNGIKIGLPSETTTNTSYLNLYIKQILAMQSRYAPSDRKLPLAIMVSDDTKLSTEQLLIANNYYGMHPMQLTIMKQEKVAALLDNDAKIAMSRPYEVDAKPHGHGDVHSLMHSTLTARKWSQAGIKYIVFFQDTNGLSFICLAATLGVSIDLDLDVNSLAVPRKAKQAVGAITKLKHTDGREMTVNVEYNQLDPLLRATISPDGDVNDQMTGFSPFPGNINQLIFKLEPYVATLNKTLGVMAEFVNPKYADKEKSIFKKATRLECMMQDYPKVLDKNSKVGFTTCPAWLCYSPCKNNAADAAASIAAGVPAGAAAVAESDQYFAPAELLRLLGASIPPTPVATYQGIPVSLGPKIVFCPSFALFPSEVKNRFPTPESLSLTSSSSLIIEGDVVVESLKLDGALKLTAEPGSRLIVKAGHMVIWNAGYAVRPVAAWQGSTFSANTSASTNANVSASSSSKVSEAASGGLGSGSNSRSSSGSGSDVSEVVMMRGYSLHKVAEEVAIAESGKEVVFTGKNVTAAVIYEQEPEASCCSYADTDTCGGCFLRAFFRFLLLQ